MKSSRVLGMGSGGFGGMDGCVERGAQWNPANPVVSFEKKGQALEVRQKDGLLRMEVDAPDVLHVTYAPVVRRRVERSFESHSRSCRHQARLAGERILE